MLKRSWSFHRIWVLSLLLALWAPAQAAENSVPTLRSLLELRQGIERDMAEVNRRLAVSQTDSEKKDLKQQLSGLEHDLHEAERNFGEVVAGIDIATLKKSSSGAFDFQQELMDLLKPVVEEMKSMTTQVRRKADLREKILRFSEQQPVVEKALANIATLLTQVEDKSLRKALLEVKADWEKQQAVIQTELQSAQLQLDRLVAEETSLAEASESYFRAFFQKRGLYLTEALLVVIGIVLLSRFVHHLLRRYMPGFRRAHRSFRVRLTELIHYVGTLFLMILGPMLVFYLEDDWVLLSLGILLLIGLALTLRNTVPRYIKQIQLFLNIGAVREGERLVLDGLPWKVNRINVFSTLVNPDAGLFQRVHIDTLVDLRSRPCHAGDSWFPCQAGHWVVLSDGVRAQVVAITEELVTLQERGGARLTYPTADFLAAKPRNLSDGFRLKEVLGISYDLQSASTGEIPARMRDYVRQRLEQEGYAEHLRDFKVEFGQAGASSLDLVMIADFDGAVAELYGRLKRVLQRLAVDACSEHGWEIPFPQLTLHGLPAGEGKGGAK